MLCRTLPGARVFIDGAAMGEADAEGWAVLGFIRDAGARAVITAQSGGAEAEQRVEIAPRQFDVQRVDGLPQRSLRIADIAAA
ncbi:MAG TPA: M23 family peptidase, partial [Terricaulis sp.]|nr:M23 family peptidase [Terricaulis sp.]